MTPMTDWYAPNQQAVREGEQGPAAEEVGVEEQQVDPLDAMTKAELIDEAESRGIDVDPTATKAEIREAIV